MNVNLGNEGVLCPNCGMTNKQGYRFCVKCGTNLATSQKPVEEPAVTPSFSTFEQPKPVEEPAATPSFSTFEQPKSVEEPAEMSSSSIFEQPKPVEEPAEMSSFSTFEQPKPVEEPAVMPSFSAFEQPKPVEEPAVMPSFSAFNQPDVPEKPTKENPFKNNQSMASGFARYDFSGTTTSTASVGTFATTFNAVKEEKMDVGDAQKILSLLDEKEKSALAEGLPEWDIVPPQVVVRRKHRI